ncbi:MAG TPA: peptidyl-prolyl cis-trans isomerase [Thermodesulforhabdus norvegica]|uniref:Peptidyl-prolyl cis-trans isomerase n=1 Tax=Thermodesulforhabdus norvegica TaxID=39841 RepID=A0A7C1AZU0_9BACT|nr:MAG: peptidyl-prolyl cis-trans isomerase [Deltaproteobacteria bacterium]RLC14662.1 MAG: peptidyl-prolyl cis-trans isomerase [Deltaproteobacteria bacterium]HDL89380.1 peptidyl-prolyl cis-trans isomerase [Thermodesulforhabdus norvegica]
MKQILLAVLMLAIIAGTSMGQESAVSNPQVVMETSKGDIVLELYLDKAPLTVKNFLDYIDAGFYSGTVFHRVIPGFMLQGGGFSRDMQKKSTLIPVKNEAFNGLKNDRGTIAMARTQDPHSASSQFFINTVDNAFLNHKSQTTAGWGYAVFGKVIKGMEVVDAISKVQTGTQGRFRDVPKTPVEIIKVRRAAP